MDEFETDEVTEMPQGSATSPRWTGAASIALAHHLNEQCVELLCNLAATSSYQELPQFVLQNRDLWRLLEPEACKHVAAFPFVIVDFRFKDVHWWREVTPSFSMSHADSTSISDLALETLLFARQAAREDINVARAMFAMSSPVATRIASLTLQQVRIIALSGIQELRVRWDSNLEFWRDLLIACRSGDTQRLAALRREAKLLFCGDYAQRRDYGGGYLCASPRHPRGG